MLFGLACFLFVIVQLVEIQSSKTKEANVKLLNEWVVRINGDYRTAIDFGKKHDLQLIGQVRNIAYGFFF
jgi:hypothetical protein